MNDDENNMIKDMENKIMEMTRIHDKKLQEMVSSNWPTPQGGNTDLCAFALEVAKATLCLAFCKGALRTSIGSMFFENEVNTQEDLDAHFQATLHRISQIVLQEDEESVESTLVDLVNSTYDNRHQGSTKSDRDIALDLFASNRRYFKLQG